MSEQLADCPRGAAWLVDEALRTRDLTANLATCPDADVAVEIGGILVDVIQVRYHALRDAFVLSVHPDDLADAMRGTRRVLREGVVQGDPVGVRVGPAPVGVGPVGEQHHHLSAGRHDQQRGAGEAGVAETGG